MMRIRFGTMFEAVISKAIIESELQPEDIEAIGITINVKRLSSGIKKLEDQSTMPLCSNLIKQLQSLIN